MTAALISLYFIIGVGVSIGQCCNMLERDPKGFAVPSTTIAGAVLFWLFWPVVITALATIALAAAADK